MGKIWAPKALQKDTNINRVAGPGVGPATMARSAGVLQEGTLQEDTLLEGTLLEGTLLEGTLLEGTLLEDTLLEGTINRPKTTKSGGPKSTVFHGGSRVAEMPADRGLVGRSRSAPPPATRSSP